MLPKYQRTKLELSDGGLMPLVTTGQGRIRVVTIPGAGDGLSTVYESARSLAWFYRRRAPHQRMHVVSRREGFGAQHGIADHATDYIEALERLQLGSVILECNSAGGPIGQQIAARRPDLVSGLVLASTAHRLDAGATGVVEAWLQMIANAKWAEFAWDTTVKTYRAADRLSWASSLVKPILGRIVRPSDPQRITHLLRGLLEFDNSSVLSRIACPTLVFGGDRDPIFATDLQRELADGITGATFVQASGHLHGADLESDRYPVEFNRLIAAAGSG